VNKNLQSQNLLEPFGMGLALSRQVLTPIFFGEQSGLAIQPA